MWGETANVPTFRSATKHTKTTDKTAASGLVSAWTVPLHVHVHIGIKVLGIYTDMKMYMYMYMHVCI